ncbi:hypothetical protein OV079_02645 [Nannocystis pusilla]|uniref:DUF4935 domain-containing protein n=1 Tax=Nannocystis pusilla TaxID=889268 RepID=A0A9X3EJT2_9BACT|nr:hypothetical protein [Nannocystis pusilla]MCY1004485.1 hypothetical protein [Nannocystis pusilla]
MNEGEKIHVFIDTCTLEKFRFDLNSSHLRKVLDADEVVLHTTKLTMLELHERMNVIIREIRHLSAKVSRVVREDEWKEHHLVPDAYRKCCGFEHDGAGADLGKLIELYVGCRLPFKKSKKPQFRDALAMLSLHHWAATNKVFVLTVSEDGDWAGSPDFPWFKRVALADVISELHKMDVERRALDGDRVAEELERAESELLEALTAVTPGIREGFQVRVDLVSSVRVVVQNIRKAGCELIARASFVAQGSGDVFDAFEHEWDLSEPVSGLVEAIFTENYVLVEVRAIEWNVELPYDPARPRSGALSARKKFEE